MCACGKGTVSNQELRIKDIMPSGSKAQFRLILTDKAFNSHLTESVPGGIPPGPYHQCLSEQIFLSSYKVKIDMAQKMIQYKSTCR